MVFLSMPSLVITASLAIPPLDPSLAIASDKAKILKFKDGIL